MAFMCYKMCQKWVKENMFNMVWLWKQIMISFDKLHDVAYDCWNVNLMYDENVMRNDDETLTQNNKLRLRRRE
jgi:hypothetical protein